MERWLVAPMQMEDGELKKRVMGTPQGGVISPVLANLFFIMFSISGYKSIILKHHGAVTPMMVWCVVEVRLKPSTCLKC